MFNCFSFLLVSYTGYLTYCQTLECLNNKNLLFYRTQSKKSNRNFWVKIKSCFGSGGSRRELISLPFLPSDHLHSLFMAHFFILESHHLSPCFKVTHLLCHSNSSLDLHKESVFTLAPLR